jgi:hypothetical protein
MYLPTRSQFAALSRCVSVAVLTTLLQGATGGAIAAPIAPHTNADRPATIGTPIWHTEVAAQLEESATPVTTPAMASTTSELQWGNTALELLVKTSQSPTLQALIKAPTIATNFDQLGDNLSLEIDGKIVERGRKINSATGLAVTLAAYFDQAQLPQTIVIHSNGKPVFLSHLATTARGTEIQAQLLNQTATVQTFQLPAPGTPARGVLGALTVMGLAPDRAQTVNAFIGDLAAVPTAVPTAGQTASRSPQLAQHFTKLLIDLQGLSQNASADRINAIITSYNRIMKTADSDTVNRLSHNPNFRALSSLLQNLSRSAAVQREAIGRTPSKAKPTQLEAEATEGFVFTGLGAS